VLATNANFHGIDINVPYVTYPGGTLDPWYGLSLTNATGTINKKSQVVVIEGTAHCRDMYSPRSADSPQVIAAQEKIAQAVADYLDAHKGCGKRLR